MNQYDKGVIDGQKSEAEGHLENLLALKRELDSVGYDSNRTFLNTLINDLEKFLADKK